MIPNTLKVSCLSLVSSLILFFFAYYHLWYLREDTLTISRLIVKTTALFSTTVSPSEPYFEASGFSMYEEKAVFILFSLAVLLAFFSLFLALKHRIMKGEHRLCLPLVFGSLAVFSSIVFVGNQIGLLRYV